MDCSFCTQGTIIVFDKGMLQLMFLVYCVYVHLSLNIFQGVVSIS